MFKYSRPKEQTYALLRDDAHPEKNRYGKSIETVPEGSELRGQSLNINGDNRIGDNPNRYKQHGFYFTADNCISCHACESACSEKNDLEPHQAFRSVGYVEGGTYPAYTRLNISMACNHCDDPVCLKGCPTRAYTKFAEYGAVLQDSEICFGCGYCTWVCPYNAPQLDHSKGHVSKCNMCVDRLEVGLKPACVSACLAGALDFGIMETTPENRDGLETSIPGFPSTDITHPNIRFQQKNSLPDEMRRTDSMPVTYKRNKNGKFEPQVTETSVSGQKAKVEWNIKKLSTRENPLVIFTLISQAVVGAFLFLFLGPLFGFETLTPEKNTVAWPMFLFGLIGIQTIALVLSTMHLGKPHRFYRAFNNLKYSPVSREVAGIALFYNFIGAFTLLTGLPQLFFWIPESLSQLFVSITGWGAVVSGLAAIYFMHKIYRIPARPFWDHWQVFTSFYGNVLTLGPILLILVFAIIQMVAGETWLQVAPAAAFLIFSGLLLEVIGLHMHQRDLKQLGGEGAAAHFEQTTKFGRTYFARNIGLISALVLTVIMMTVDFNEISALIVWVSAAIIIVLAAITGRALFYALVMPTTMPGAFFWRNKKFQEHARETGLADMPQVGVLPEMH
ncbi:Anaerobic dimethyl sulfoxide reductase chain B, iron-sulfur binding subunit [hydrothermal vent metagenome]|uniref:Anaerobic dimethyl sulfoxide reductase chain B, iron-sulfur binding subunit n=1 Tax=hydrothermal vent metagenome TaxID=652676 RepID=A0A3B0WW02_9ZZZZ